MLPNIDAKEWHKPRERQRVLDPFKSNNQNNDNTNNGNNGNANFIITAMTMLVIM